MTMLTAKRPWFVMMVLGALGVLQVKAQTKIVELNDVANLPYTQEIQNAVGYGLFSGKEGNRFDPTGAFSREQVAAVAFSMLGNFPGNDGLRPPTGLTETPFEDVAPNRWSAGVVTYLAQVGLMKGYEQGPGRKNLFKPEQTVSRAELVAIFRAVVEFTRQKAGLEPPSPLFQSGKMVFTDVPDAHWARLSVLAMTGYCQAAHVADKKPGTFFGPGEPANRAFAAAVGSRVYECLNKEILNKAPTVVQTVRLVSPPAPKVLTDDEWSVEVAKIGVGFRYWWGGGPLKRGATEKGYCRGNCPSCSGAGPYGADCSGYVAKVWRLPEAMPLESMKHPYSAASFTRGSSSWRMVSRSAMKVGHAGATSYHVFLIGEMNKDNWGMPFVYEAKGCSWGIIANYKNLGAYVLSEKLRPTGPAW